MSKTELLKLLRDGLLVFGADVVTKKVKTGHIAKVFLAKNAPKDAVQEITYLQKVTSFEIEQSDMTNVQLGELCKKPFSISIIGVAKSK